MACAYVCVSGKWKVRFWKVWWCVFDICVEQLLLGTRVNISLYNKAPLLHNFILFSIWERQKKLEYFYGVLHMC